MDLAVQYIYIMLIEITKCVVYDYSMVYDVYLRHLTVYVNENMILLTVEYYNRLAVLSSCKQTCLDKYNFVIDIP